MDGGVGWREGWEAARMELEGHSTAFSGVAHEIIELELGEGSGVEDTCHRAKGYQ